MFLGLCVLVFELFFLPKVFIQFLKMLQGLFIEGLVYGVGFHHREDDLVLMSLGSQGPCAGEMSKWGEHWLCIVLMDPTPVDRGSSQWSECGWHCEVVHRASLPLEHQLFTVSAGHGSSVHPGPLECSLAASKAMSWGQIGQIVFVVENLLCEKVTQSLGC